MIWISLIACLLVFTCVVVHLLAFRLMASLLMERKHLKSAHVAIMIMGSIIAHLIEIVIFQIAYIILILSDGFGHIQGADDMDAADAFYFSAVTYTSLGFGDLVPVGHLRVLATVETLTGLILIAWTASFVLIVMQRFWANVLAEERKREANK